MDNWLTIFFMTFALLAVALFGMAIGWLLTGRNRMHKRCGSKPGQRDEGCGKNSSCELCDPSLGENKRQRQARKTIDDD